MQEDPIQGLQDPASAGQRERSTSFFVYFTPARRAEAGVICRLSTSLATSLLWMSKPSPSPATATLKCPRQTGGNTDPQCHCLRCWSHRRAPRQSHRSATSAQIRPESGIRIPSARPETRPKVALAVSLSPHRGLPEQPSPRRGPVRDADNRGGSPLRAPSPPFPHPGAEVESLSG